MSTQPRVSFHFPREAALELSHIGSYTRLEGASNIVRVALSSYSDLLKVTRAGCKIFIRDQDGNDYTYSLFAPFYYPGFKKLEQTKVDNVSRQAVPRNLFFSGAAVDELVAIRKGSFVQNNADAIRAALTAFSELVRVVAAGDEIIIRDRRGNERVHDPRAPLVREGLDLDQGDGSGHKSSATSTSPQRPATSRGMSEAELVS